MRSRFLKGALAIAVLCPLLAAEDLSIGPVQQDTPEWCWLAVGEMIFTYYDIPNLNPAGLYQCGVVGVMVGGPCALDCRFCSNVPAGSVEMIRRMITGYPQFARSYLRNSGIKRLDARVATRALTADEIKDEIGAGRPIIAGISPTGSGAFGPQHAVLIVGYDGDDDTMDLIVNDPFPYGVFSPYEAAGGEGGRGQFTIGYMKFRSRLRWTQSVYRIDEP
jgi:hypothetical protein